MSYSIAFSMGAYFWRLWKESTGKTHFIFLYNVAKMYYLLIDEVHLKIDEGLLTMD